MGVTRDFIEGVETMARAVVKYHRTIADFAAGEAEYARRLGNHKIASEMDAVARMHTACASYWSYRRVYACN